MKHQEIKKFTEKIRKLTLSELIDQKIINAVFELDSTLKDLQQIMRKDKRYRNTIRL